MSRVTRAALVGLDALLVAAPLVSPEPGQQLGASVQGSPARVARHGWACALGAPAAQGPRGDADDLGGLGLGQERLIGWAAHAADSVQARSGCHTARPLLAAFDQDGQLWPLQGRLPSMARPDDGARRRELVERLGALVLELGHLMTEAHELRLPVWPEARRARKTLAGWVNDLASIIPPRGPS